MSQLKQRARHMADSQFVGGSQWCRSDLIGRDTIRTLIGSDILTLLRHAKVCAAATTSKLERRADPPMARERGSAASRRGRRRIPLENILESAVERPVKFETLAFTSERRAQRDIFAGRDGRARWERLAVICRVYVSPNAPRNRRSRSAASARTFSVARLSTSVQTVNMADARVSSVV